MLIHFHHQYTAPQTADSGGMVQFVCAPSLRVTASPKIAAAPDMCVLISF